MSRGIYPGGMSRGNVRIPSAQRYHIAAGAKRRERHVYRSRLPLKQSSDDGSTRTSHEPTNCVITATDGRRSSPPPVYGKQTGTTDGPYRRRTPARRTADGAR